MSDLHVLRRADRLAIVEVGLDSRVETEPHTGGLGTMEIDTVVLRVAEKNGNGKQRTVTVDLDSPIGQIVRQAFFQDPA